MKSFLLHLRLHYQIFILSGPFLLGVLLSESFSELQILQFFSVHILLFGGVTAYNSYYDKDEGPIGGLEHPPKMQSWMLVASWVLQFIGLIISLPSGPVFSVLYILCMVIFWMYSSPKVRLKGRPIASLVAMGLGTVVCACLLGYYANGSVSVPSQSIVLAALGSMALIISMYPLSQVYQVEEDKKRGDITFSVRYGKKGVRKAIHYFFPLGVLLVSASLISLHLMYTVLFLVGGLIAFIIINIVIKRITMTADDYKIVMKTKYMGGLLFSLLVLLLILIK